MRKSIFSFILTLILIVSTLSVPVQATELTKSDAQTQYSIQGADSFGELLSEEVEEYTAALKDSGSNIFSVAMNENVAQVSFETIKSGTLLVAVYDESGSKLLFTGQTDVEAQETEAMVTVDTTAMPDYFYLRAYLLDEETYKPYSRVYESSLYTKNMQDFLSKTTADFPQDRVLNLDEDENNNYAVYEQDVTVIPGSKDVNALTYADSEKEQYIFEKTDDKLKQLQPGDILSYESADGVLIIKIAFVKIENDTMIIDGTDTTIKEVFDYVKIDTASSLDGAVIDTSTCGEGITYLGQNSKNISENRASDSMGGTKSLSYEIDTELGKNGKVTGSVNVSVEYGLTFYLENDNCQVDFVLDYQAILDMNLSGHGSEQKDLAKISFPVVAGVTVELVPSLVVETDADVQLYGMLVGMAGFSASTEHGIKNLTSHPVFNSYLDGEMTVYVGLHVRPSIHIVSEKIIEVAVDAELGAQLKGELYIGDEMEEDISEMHLCEKCIDGEINGIFDISFSVDVIGLDSVKESRG